MCSSDLAAQRAGWLAHPGEIEALAFARDGRSLVSSGNDGTIKRWNLTAHNVAWTNICGAAANALAFEASGAAIDAGCGWVVRRIDARTGKTLPSLRGHGGDVDALAITARGRLLSAAEDGTLKSWDLIRRDAAATYGAIATAALTPNGRWLTYGRGDDELRVLDLKADRERAILGGNLLLPTLGSYSYSRAAVAISDDADYVAAGGYVTEGFIDHTGIAKGVTRVWRATNAHAFRTIQAAPGIVRFGPSDRALVVRSPAMSDTPDTTWTLDLSTGRLKAWIAQWSTKRADGFFPTCRLAGFDASAIAFTLPRPSLLVVSSDGVCPDESSAKQPLRLWPIGSRAAGAPLGPAISPQASLALSADERTAATFDGRLDVWNVRSHRLAVSGPVTNPLGDPYAHMTEFTIGGSRALGLVLYDSTHTGIIDRYEIVVWDLHTGKLIARTPRRVALERSHLLVPADGTRAYVSSPAGLDVWTLAPP